MEDLDLLIGSPVLKIYDLQCLAHPLAMPQCSISHLADMLISSHNREELNSCIPLIHNRSVDTTAELPVVPGSVAVWLARLGGHSARHPIQLVPPAAQPVLRSLSRTLGKLHSSTAWQEVRWAGGTLAVTLLAVLEGQRRRRSRGRM